METVRGKSRDDILNKLADRIESFEKYTHPHSAFMAEAAERLAARLGLSIADREAIRQAALLHDIGLYAMNPGYHALPGSLSLEQRIDLWRHPVVGEQQMAKRNSTRHAQLLVRWHHEWWNGSGYPDGLAHEAIPVGARIIRVVELFSSLLSNRPYRGAMPLDQALVTLQASAGVECDPSIVSAFLRMIEPVTEQPSKAEQASQAEPISQAEQVSQTGPIPDPLDISFDHNPTSSSAPIASSSFAKNPWNLSSEPLELVSEQETNLNSEISTTSANNASPYADSQPAPETNHSDTHPTADGYSFSRPFTESTDLRSVPSEAVPPQQFSIERFLASSEEGQNESPSRLKWKAAVKADGSILGFEASVLRQLEFKSIAVAVSGWARLELYLKLWGKLVLSNDPRAWAAAAARAAVEARTPLNEDQILALLRDVYIPGTRLNNGALKEWFSETDAWWLDNLRRNISTLDDENARAQALVLGLQTGEYALSFDEDTVELRRPLTTVFCRLAGRQLNGPPALSQSRSLNEPVPDFVRRARAEILYLPLSDPAMREDSGNPRMEWRDAWVKQTGLDRSHDPLWPGEAIQSRQAFLSLLNRLLGSGAHFKTWAIAFQETGLVSASEIVELIKEHRPVRATYSKDLTEVVGGLRHYIAIADRK